MRVHLNGNKKRSWTCVYTCVCVCVRACVRICWHCMCVLFVLSYVYVLFFCRFCQPEVIQISRDANMKQLQNEILHHMGDAVKEEVFQQVKLKKIANKWSVMIYALGRLSNQHTCTIF